MQFGHKELISNHHLSSDCSLQLENMKSESLVIVDQHATVNLYLSLVHTARHTMKVSRTQKNSSVHSIGHTSYENIRALSLCRNFNSIVYDCSEVVTR